MNNYKEVETLVLQYQSTKNPVVYGKLYSLYYEKLYAYIYKIAKDRDVAFDLTQNVFIKASTKIDSLKIPTFFPLWIFKIAKNAAFEYEKNKSYSFDISAVTNINYFEEQNEEDDKDNEYNLTLLNKLVSNLSADEQHLIQQKYYQDKSIVDLCNELHLGESAVKMKIHRVRQKLHKQMVLKKVG